MHPGRLLAYVGAVSFLFFFQPCWGKTLNYPGDAPCDGTLQTCIDGATAGDIVELATNDPITENLEIARSLTLRAAEGFVPIIGGGAEEVSVDLCGPDESGTGSVSIVIEGLTFDFARVSCSLGAGQRYRRLTLRNNTITYVKNEQGFPVLDFFLLDSADILIEGNLIDFALDHNGVPAIGFDVRNTSANVTVENNDIASTGTSVTISGNDASGLQAMVSRNRVTASDSDRSQTGVEIILKNGGTYTASVLGNVVYGVGGCNCGRNSGIHVTSAGFTGKADLTVTHNTITATAPGADGLLALLDGEGEIALNVYNNSVSGAGSSGFRLINWSTGPFSMNGDTNNSFDNAFPDYFQDLTPLTPMAVNPLFVSEGGHDYRLRANSPLIDAGTDEPIGGTTTLDAEGDQRRSGAAVDIGAYEFAVVNPVFFKDREAFLSATGAITASAPYSPGTSPGPFQSGQVSFDPPHPSTLNFGDWPADFPNDNDVELAINDKEDLDITYIGGFVYAMGIDFDDASGGSTPSTFDIVVKTGLTQLANFQFETQNEPDQNYIGVWSREPFNRLEIRETTTENENEFFGTVSVSQVPLPRTIFRDGFEPAP
jgi:hypothetical protein